MLRHRGWRFSLTTPRVRPTLWLTNPLFILGTEAPLASVRMTRRGLPSGGPEKGRFLMKTSFSLLAMAGILGLGGALRAQDPLSFTRGALGSGADLVPSLADTALGGLAGNSPFSQGLGQFVSDWTGNGFQGNDLSDRIQWLQSMRAEEREQRLRDMDWNRGFDRDRDDRFRDRDDRFRDRDREDRF